MTVTDANGRSGVTSLQARIKGGPNAQLSPILGSPFLVGDTIEERIAAILDRKESVFEDVVESTETAAPGFTVQELMRILELSAGDVSPTHRETEGN